MSATLPHQASASESFSRVLEREPLPPSRGPVILATTADGESDAPIVAARLLAEHLGTRLEVVSVLEPLPGIGIGVEMAPIPPTYEEDRRQILTDTVRQNVTSVLGTDARWGLHVTYGPTALAIAEAAKSWQAGMIVAGIGRHRPMDRIFGNEIALQVLRLSDRPVLAVAPGFTALPRRALAAVDFSPASVRALLALLPMLEEGATLTIVNVRPYLEWNQPVFDEWDLSVARGIGGMFERLREELRPHVPAGVTIETRCLVGDTVEKILECADALDADIIAVGTHGPNFVERLLVGSIASGVLRRSTRTVLAAPTPPPAERVRIELSMLGTSESAKPEEWATMLDGFARRNVGRRTRLEIDDPDIGAQVEQSGYALLGAAYDRHDGRIEIMLGDFEDTVHHLTRTIARAASVAVSSDANGRDQALRISHDGGQTLLILDPLKAPPLSLGEK